MEGSGWLFLLCWYLRAGYWGTLVLLPVTYLFTCLLFSRTVLCCFSFQQDSLDFCVSQFASMWPKYLREKCKGKNSLFWLTLSEVSVHCDGEGVIEQSAEKEMMLTI
jgi:hypothetical protein